MAARGRVYGSFRTPSTRGAWLTPRPRTNRPSPLWTGEIRRGVHAVEVVAHGCEGARVRKLPDALDKGRMAHPKAENESTVAALDGRDTARRPCRRGSRAWLRGGACTEASGRPRQGAHGSPQGRERTARRRSGREGYGAASMPSR